MTKAKSYSLSRNTPATARRHSTSSGGPAAAARTPARCGRRAATPAAALPPLGLTTFAFGEPRAAAGAAAAAAARGGAGGASGLAALASAAASSAASSAPGGGRAHGGRARRAVERGLRRRNQPSMHFQWPPWPHCSSRDPTHAHVADDADDAQRLPRAPPTAAAASVIAPPPPPPATPL